MNLLRPFLILCIVFSATTRTLSQENGVWFQFDPADHTIKASMLENRLFYDAGVAVATNGLWIAWLEHVPGQGDELWVGLRNNQRWTSKVKLSSGPGKFAKPTPTVDAQGNLWVSYEAADAGGNWDVWLRRRKRDGAFTLPQRISPNPANDVHHHAAPDTKDGIWIVWQGDTGGRFRLHGARIRGDSASPVVLGTVSASSWFPTATVAPDGALHVAWDAYAAGSYNVLAQRIRHQPAMDSGGDKSSTSQIGRVTGIATTPNFEAHAQIASDGAGKLWILWEEDGENWGQRYITRTEGEKKSTRMTDQVGPLHRFRRLHLATFDEQAGRLTEYEIPQPSFDLARNRTDLPEGVENFGTYYERGQLVVDGQNRPWIVYRHFYAPYLGVNPESHKQDNMRLYARCLLKDGWSELYTFSEGQGDGMQRISVAPKENGIAVVWTTGRTDRRKSPHARGVALAEITLDETKARLTARKHTRELNSKDAKAAAEPRQRPASQVAGKSYELFFGDLHRHTDISLCYSPMDGTIDDAYRYAIDAAPLDFLGITDHTHDLESGAPLSQLWWRARKEADRHQLQKRFVPFYSYERSRGETDHNVITLDPDVMRPHTYPHADFWKEIGTNTITIPHAPFNRVLWDSKDNQHRPLLEVYQGFRNMSGEDAVADGLQGGHEFGLIASSDHLSTSASFACVWAEAPTRESIFRALQARRTYGATDKIRLRVTAGEHWMGEKFAAEKMPALRIEAEGTAPFERIDFLVDGIVKESLPLKAASVKVEHRLKAPLTGLHSVYVRLHQTDGNRAWSSPLWIDLRPEPAGR